MFTIFGINCLRKDKKNVNFFFYRNFGSVNKKPSKNSEVPFLSPTLLTTMQQMAKDSSMLQPSSLVQAPVVNIQPNSNTNVLDKDKNQLKAGGVAIKKISSGLMLAQSYNSESDTDHEDADHDIHKNIHMGIPNLSIKIICLCIMLIFYYFFLDFPVPPSDLQNIIDKTAAYVLKNGKEFEDILRTKNDSRFSFLSHTDEFYRYYTYKVTGAILPLPIVLTNGQLQKNKVTTLKTTVSTPLSTKQSHSKKELSEPKTIS